MADVDARSPELAYVTKPNIVVPKAASPKPSEVPKQAAKRDQDNRVLDTVTYTAGSDTVQRQRNVKIEP